MEDWKMAKLVWGCVRRSSAASLTQSLTLYLTLALQNKNR